MYTVHGILGNNSTWPSGAWRVTHLAFEGCRRFSVRFHLTDGYIPSGCEKDLTGGSQSLVIGALVSIPKPQSEDEGEIRPISLVRDVVTHILPKACKRAGGNRLY
jgi:hypothetical protein